MAAVCQKPGLYIVFGICFASHVDCTKEKDQLLSLNQKHMDELKRKIKIEGH